MPYTLLLQNWTRVRGGANQVITQDESDWLDTSAFQSLQFFIDVKNQTGSPSRYAYANIGFFFLGRAMQSTQRFVGREYNGIIQELLLDPLSITRLEQGHHKKGALAGEPPYFMGAPAVLHSVSNKAEFKHDGNIKLSSLPLQPANYYGNYDVHEATGGLAGPAIDVARFLASFEVVDGNNSTPTKITTKKRDKIFYEPLDATGTSGSDYAFGWVTTTHNLPRSRVGPSSPTQTVRVAHKVGIMDGGNALAFKLEGMFSVVLLVNQSIPEGLTSGGKALGQGLSFEHHGKKILKALDKVSPAFWVRPGVDDLFRRSDLHPDNTTNPWGTGW